VQLTALAERASPGEDVAPDLAAEAVPDGTGPVATLTVGGLSPTARQAVEAGIPDETRRGYSGDWHRFEQWCQKHGLNPLPASADTLTEYVTHLTTTPRPRTGRPYRPASIDRAMASIAVAHQAAEQTPPNTTGARLVLRGYLAELHDKKDPHRRPRRAAAATPAVLRKMTAATDTTSVIGARDAAALLLGFALAARRSELRSLDWSDLADVEEGLQVEVWRPKVQRDHPLGVPYGNHPGTCPVRAVRAYRARLIEADHTPVGPVFLRVDRHGRIAHPITRHGKEIGDRLGRLTGRAVGDIVARAAKRAGLSEPPTEMLPDLPPRWSGHSLRRGFATAAKQAGADLLETGRHGGWRDGSAALASYFEQAGTWDDANPLYGIGL
jgi:integrase